MWDVQSVRKGPISGCITNLPFEPCRSIGQLVRTRLRLSLSQTIHLPNEGEMRETKRGKRDKR